MLADTLKSQDIALKKKNLNGNWLGLSASSNRLPWTIFLSRPQPGPIKNYRLSTQMILSICHTSSPLKCLLGKAQCYEERLLFVLAQTPENPLGAVTFKGYIFPVPLQDVNLLPPRPPRAVFSKTWKPSLSNANIQGNNSGSQPRAALLLLVLLLPVIKCEKFISPPDKHPCSPLTNPLCLFP